MKKTTEPRLPDFETACAWWEDLPNIWTPVGWINHLYKFNVFWNGSILAEPKINRRAAALKEQGVQVAFAPHYTEWFNEFWPYLRVDDHEVIQGWEPDDAPVLWSEWSRDGVKWRQSVFAHIPGGGETQTGVEPMFAWIRMRIHDLCPALPLEDHHGFHLLFHNPHVSCSMDYRDDVRIWPEHSPYPLALKLEPTDAVATRGARLLDAEGKVRFGIAPGGGPVGVRGSGNDKIPVERPPIHRTRSRQWRSPRGRCGSWPPTSTTSTTRPWPRSTRTCARCTSVRRAACWPVAAAGSCATRASAARH